jgi:hypothetical protein
MIRDPLASRHDHEGRFMHQPPPPPPGRFGLLSVNIFTGGLLGLIGALWLLWDSRKQALWDKLAKTYVVQG